MSHRTAAWYAIAVSNFRRCHRSGAPPLVAGVGGFFMSDAEPDICESPGCPVPPTCRFTRLRGLKCAKPREGLEAAINDRPWPGRERKLDGRQEAHLIAFACSAARRSHALDTPVVGRQGGGVGVCREHLPGDGAPDAQKNELKPWKKKEWCIPKVSGEFVARMEDVLDLYQPEYNPERPVVCFDETSRQCDWGRCVRPSRLPPDGWHAMTPSTSETGPGTCS